MNFKKNDIIELQINDIGVGGEGVGRVDGFTFFVKDAVEGDTVRAVVTMLKKGYGYAKMTEIVRPSPYRITPPCPDAKRCGGCQIMELQYEKQLEFKTRKVRNNLEKIGGLQNAEVLPVIGMEAADLRRLYADGTPENETWADCDSVPVRYRNKMQFPFGRDREGRIVAGFYAGRTHHIIDTDDCALAPEVCSRILKAVKDFVREYRIPVYNEATGQGLLRHLILRTGFRTGEIMVCLVLNGESLNEADYIQDVDSNRAFVDKLLNTPLSCGCRRADYEICSICINVNRENTNVILGKTVHCLYGRPYIYDEICCGEERERLRFKISPLSFYQVNPVQMEKLYSKALEFAQLTGEETVWDLYCGTGTISLFLARKAKKVMGVEIVPEAIRDAEENAARNQITNAGFLCGKSEEVFPAYIDQMRSLEAAEDGTKSERQEKLVVVLDPPRKGCDAVLLEKIMEVGPERIVYVSCDSATLARDLKLLTGRKDGLNPELSAYSVQKIQPVDMFPNSVHVETVVLLTGNT